MTKDWQKYYVVRKWKIQWIFSSRDECKLSVNWYSWAKYKSFSSLEDAEIALKKNWESYYTNNSQINKKEKANIEIIPFYHDSIAVDAACSWNPGIMEYRWIDLQTGEEIFHKKFELWTNNIWEFLAIVHGLNYLKENSNKKIYSDSKIAISRVSQWKCKTQINCENNPSIQETLKAIKKAEIRLKENWIKNEILKRNTDNRWEIPADFWRK